MPTKKYEYGLWRRKQSTAMVKLFSWGKWNIYVVSWDKKLTIKEYFGWNTHLLENALYSFHILWDNISSSFDIEIKLSWWGIRGQAEAIKLWLSRALVAYNADYRLQLKPYWLLKRDSREKERKKFGLKKARKSPQWTKR